MRRNKWTYEPTTDPEDDEIEDDNDDEEGDGWEFSAF